MQDAKLDYEHLSFHVKVTKMKVEEKILRICDLRFN